MILPPSPSSYCFRISQHFLCPSSFSCFPLSCFPDHVQHFMTEFCIYYHTSVLRELIHLPSVLLSLVFSGQCSMSVLMSNQWFLYIYSYILKNIFECYKNLISRIIRFLLKFTLICPQLKLLENETTKLLANKFLFFI